MKKFKGYAIFYQGELIYSSIRVTRKKCEEDFLNGSKYQRKLGEFYQCRHISINEVFAAKPKSKVLSDAEKAVKEAYERMDNYSKEEMDELYKKSKEASKRK